MRHHIGIGLLSAVVFGSLVAPGCSEDQLAYDGPRCGIEIICGVDEDDGSIPDIFDEPDMGRADAMDVEGEITALGADGVLSVDDIRSIFDAAGNRIGRREMRLIRDALENPNYEVPADAMEAALDLAQGANLFETEVNILLGSNTSYGGSAIPQAVRDLVARARLNGAEAFDTQEMNEDGEGVWSPYPSITPPTENMTFEYTEVTPERLAEDLADTTTTYNAIVGTETAENCDGNECTEYQQARYEQHTGGSGNVLSQYDEAYHPDIYARGGQDQIWANNCAILSDGSVHCLPASRRSESQNIILTNPHLSRCNDVPGYEDACRHLLYNGHFDIRAGVVTGMEMSGRLSKRAAEGDAIFIDPIALLEAWGFEMSPNLTIRYGNTSEGVPVRDLERGVIVAP